METLSNRGEARSVNRAIAVLRYLAEAREPKGVSELGRALSVPKSTLHAILQSLTDAGFVTATPEKKYQLGPGLLDLVVDYAASKQKDLPRPGPDQPQVDSTGGPVRIGIVDNGEVVYLLSLQKASRPAPRARFVVRSEHPLPGHPPGSPEAPLALPPEGRE